MTDVIFGATKVPRNVKIRKDFEFLIEDYENKTSYYRGVQDKDMTIEELRLVLRQFVFLYKEGL